MANWRIFLWAAIVLAALGFLYAVRSILMPFVLGWVIAILLEPVVRKLRLRGWSRGLSVAAITAGFFIVMTGVLALTVPKLASQGREMQSRVQVLADAAAAESRSSNHFTRWSPVVRAEPPGPLGMVDKMLDQVAPIMGRFGLPSSRRAIMEQYIEPQQEEIANSAAGFFNSFVKMIGDAASQLMLLVLVPLLVFLFLLDMERIQLQTASWIPPSLRAGTLSIASEIGTVFKKFLRGVTINVSIYMVVMAILLSICGVPYALILAIISGVFYLIPMIGPWLSAPIIIMVVGMSGKTDGLFMSFSNSWTFALVVTTIFLLVTATYDTLVNPRVVGKSVDLNPLISMFVVFAGSALFGLAGMLLAFPVAGSVKVTLGRLMKLTNQPLQDGSGLPAVPVRHRAPARTEN
jgi:predicted PurR-regulated permease PerM